MAVSITEHAPSATPATTRVGAGTSRTAGTTHAVPVAGGHGVHPPGQGSATARAATTRSTQVRAGVANRPANWLQPLSPQQVVSQANSLVKTAYAPAWNEFGAETKTLNGVLTKQQADNQFYQTWLDHKSNALLANQQVVDNATNALTRQLTGNQQAMLSSEDQNLTNEANARPGNVTPNNAAFNPGSPMGNFLEGGQVAANAELTGAANATLAGEQTQNNALGSAIANTGAAIAAGGARETAAYNAALQKIQAGESSLGAKESSALVSELARLQGAQITLSEANRNYGTAVQKLGISAANTSSEIASRAAATKLGQEKFAQQVSQDKFNNWVKNQQLGQNEQKIAISLANSQSLQAYRNAEIAAKANGGYLTINETNTVFDQVKKAQGTINGLIQQGMNPKVAYAAVLNGYYIGSKKLASGKTEQVKIAVPRMSNQSLLNAAYNTSTAGTGLTPGDVGAFKSMFINPAWIPREFQVQGAQQQAGSAASNAATAVGNALGGL